MSEHAVIVEFRYGQTDLGPLFSLEDDLRAAISRAACGELDGHEIATDGSDGKLFMYGSDADKLFAVVEPILRATPFMSGASVTKRYGPSEGGTREVRVVIETQGMDKQAASEVLKRAKELTRRGLAAQAIDVLMPLTSFYDPAIKLDALVELSTNQATLHQHLDVLTSLDRIERTLNEDLNLEKLQTSPNERVQDFVQQMRFIRHSRAATASEGLGRIEEAIAHARSAVGVVRARRKPGDANRVAHREYVLALMLRLAGHVEQALAALDVALAESPDHIPSLIAKAGYLELAGRKDEGEALFTTIQPQGEDALAYFKLNGAWYHALRGEKASMLKLLEEATYYWGGPMVVAYALEGKDFAPYREDPDFLACVDRCRLLERRAGR